MHHEEPAWARSHPLRPKRHDKAQQPAAPRRIRPKRPREPGGRETKGATTVGQLASVTAEAPRQGGQTGRTRRGVAQGTHAGRRGSRRLRRPESTSQSAQTSAARRQKKYFFTKEGLC